MGYNAFLIRKEGNTEYYRINVYRHGVVQVLEEFPYSGEDFVVAMRGEDWYIAFTKRYHRELKTDNPGKGGES